MSERVQDSSYWIEANGASDPEMASLILGALVAPGDYGAITVRAERGGKLVVGPVSSLFLADDEAEMAFSLLLEDYTDE